jgi:hypothetical protein
MTILSASQQAIMRLVGQKPAAVVSSSDEICVEMTALAQDAAEEIAKGNDWQALIRFQTITTDGTASSYDMPDDYDRMVVASGLYDPDNWFWNYRNVSSYGEWLQYQISDFGMIAPGIWTIYQDQFHFLPLPASGQKAVFPYVTKNIFKSSQGHAKAAITSDSDEFLLGDRILTLALVWKWLSLKRMDYQQEVDDYNIAVSEMAARDRGARVIRSGRPAPRLNLRTAWPWPLGGV